MRGHVGVISRGGISGWAANPENPDEEVVLIVRVNGRPSRVRANEMREELKKDFPGATGKYAFKFQPAHWPLSPFQTFEIEVRYAADGQLLPRGKATLHAVGSGPESKPPAVPEMMPLLLTTTGRSGSSLLMGRLGNHPEILVAREHPFEMKLLSYHSLALRTLVSDSDRKNSTDPDTMGGNRNKYFIGFNPFNTPNSRREAGMSAYWNGTLPNTLRDTFRSLTDEFYKAYGISTGKPAAKYFAEKVGTLDVAVQGTRFMYGALKEIVLLRDPRDVVCSARAFWKLGFPQAVENISNQMTYMTRPRKDGHEAPYMVKYEDLVLKPSETLGAIFGYLGLDASKSPDVSEDAAIVAHHVTSGSPSKSIGRWRRDLTAEELQICNKTFGPMLPNNGYELS